MHRLGNANTYNESDNINLESVGLYDITNVSKIIPLIGNETKPEIVESEWKLKSSSNERFLAVASCSDLAVFQLSETASYFYTASLGGNITSCAIIGESGFIAIVIDYTSLIILSLENQQIFLNENMGVHMDYLNFSYSSKYCILTFASNDGEFIYILMDRSIGDPKESNLIENDQTSAIVEYFKKAISKAITKKVNLKSSFKNVISIENGYIPSLVAIDENKNIHLCDVNSSNFFELENEKNWIAVRDTGRYALLLSDDGYIHVFDPLTFYFLEKFCIKKLKTNTIKDFIVVDKNTNEIPMLFAFLVDTGNEFKMVIYDRKKDDSILTIPSSASTSLFSYSGSDRVLMLIEETQNDQVENSEITIRQISESRPDMRFEALLKHCRFDEAEKFAKTYKLDVQRVYKARVEYLTENCDDNDESFNFLMKTMDMITDHNMVAETCFTLVQMSKRFDRIHSYLCYAKKRRITDIETLKLIETECYILATFRIIAGPRQDDTCSLFSDIWNYFVDALHGNERWIGLYTSLITNSALNEARVIWQRHGKEIQNYINQCGDVELETESSMKLDALFDIFYDALTTDINNWKSIVEHLSLDILPSCLDLANQLVPRIEKLVVSVINMLEHRASDRWPDNAIEAASCFDHMTEFLSDNAVTPTETSFLALYGNILIVDKEGNSSTPISRMKKLYYTLLQIKRLKTVYECDMSLSTYLSSTSEEICHRILQNALVNPNLIHAKIEKLVKPFMKERHLKQDQTIFNYIKYMSDLANNNQDSNQAFSGWEEQCVQLCASLADESRQCSSIISIASTAKLPWPTALNDVVDKILKSTTLSRTEIESMRSVCRSAELNRLLSTYGYPRNYINVVTESQGHFEEIIMVIRCILAQTEKSSRFVDCIKVLELYALVQNNDLIKSVRVEYAKSLAIVHMIRSGEMTSSIINYLNELNEKERDIVIDLVVSFIESVANTPASKDTMSYREEVLGIGEQLLSYFANRSRGEECEMTELRRKLILIRELQSEDDESVILLSDFDDEMWKRNQLKRIAKEDICFQQKIAKCRYLHICEADFINYLISKAEINDDAGLLIDLLVEMADCCGPSGAMSVDLIDSFCSSLSYIIYRLPKISEEKPEAERADDIAFIVQKLVYAVRKVIGSGDHEVLSSRLGYLVQLEGYLYLCERVIRQSVRAQDWDPNNQKDDGMEASTAMGTAGPFSNDDMEMTIVTSCEPRIYGFSRRHGTYDFACDPVLFEGVSGVIAIANVAPSVSRPFESEIKDEDANDFRAAWEQLTMFFAMHSQDLLDISARVFATSLKCWNREWREAIVEIGQSVVSVVERMIQQDKFDAWHAVTLLSGLPNTILPQKIMELRNSPGTKRNTQSQLNFLQLAFFMSIMMDNTEIQPMIIASYEQKYIVKQFAKEGIRTSLSNSAETIDKIIEQAADLSQPMAPNRLFELMNKIVGKFMKNRKLNVSELMIRYAFILVRKASKAGDISNSLSRAEEIERYLDLAGSALRLVDRNHSDLLCKYLTCLVYIVCPYNYEVIQFICRHIGMHAVDDKDTEFHSVLKSILSFLWKYERSSHLTREESVWYTKLQQTIARCEKYYNSGGFAHFEPMGDSIRLSYEGSSMNTSDSSLLASDTTSASDAMIYEKNDVIISEVPLLASKRIPLLVFLMRRKEDIDEVLMPIVKSELSIYNVVVWQMTLRSVSWLSTRFSRTQLLSSAIFAHANRFATVERPLPDGDKASIFHLLNNTTNRSVVISTIALLFRKIILSDVKIDLLQMGVDLAEQWLKNDKIDPPMSESERQVVEDQCFRLRDGISKFYTELALKQNGLYNEKTSEKIEKVEELCALIYEEMIEWNNITDVEEKCEIVEKIAQANSIDLAQLHEKLVFNWIDSISTNQNYENIDMNDSLGEASYMDLGGPGADKGMANKDDRFRLPLFDRNLQKIYIISRRLDKMMLLKRLANIIIKGGAKVSGGYEAVTKAACLMIRSFSDDELNAFNENASHVWICERLEFQLYYQLAEMANVKVDMDADKNQLIKSLFQSPSRTPLMTSLIACLMIDYSYKEVKNIEQIMARLQIAKQWNVLRSLLNYAKLNGIDSMIRSFSLLWFKVYENYLMEINGGSTNKDWNYAQCVTMRRLSLWALSNNVEGGRQAGVSRLLREIRCPVSASIVSILANFTVDKMDDVDVSCLEPTRDLPLIWASKLVNN